MPKGNGDLNSKVPCKTKFMSLYYYRRKESWGVPKMNSFIQQLFIEGLPCTDTVLVAEDTAENKTDRIPAHIPASKEES